MKSLLLTLSLSPISSAPRCNSSVLLVVASVALCLRFCRSVLFAQRRFTHSSYVCCPLSSILFCHSVLFGQYELGIHIRPTYAHSPGGQKHPVPPSLVCVLPYRFCLSSLSFALFLSLWRSGPALFFFFFFFSLARSRCLPFFPRWCRGFRPAVGFCSGLQKQERMAKMAEVCTYNMQLELRAASWTRKKFG